ncbi:MAG: ribose 5-phosphate isomerase B [Anaerolineales bacterium]|nr:ribose 5-phosphate isomerase B [Anaerolineales bacterium]
MKIAVACDHGGFPLKETILETIRAAGHEPIDLGTDGPAGVDYPDFAQKIGVAINSGEAERGILICGSGAGANIAANKIKGIYASVCHDAYSAHQGVEHDDMNVLCLGARIIGPALAAELVEAFTGATYWDTGNYKRRVEKVHAIEAAGK